MPGDWSAWGLCRGCDPDLWYPIPGRGTPVHSVKDIQLAKDICRACSVQEPCLQYALRNESTYWTESGIWGGFDPRERAKVLGHERVGRYSR